MRTSVSLPAIIVSILGAMSSAAPTVDIETKNFEKALARRDPAELTKRTVGGVRVTMKCKLLSDTESSADNEEIDSPLSGYQLAKLWLQGPTIEPMHCSYCSLVFFTLRS